MNQKVLIFTTIALIAGAFGLTQGGGANLVWIAFFGSAATAAYFYWRNRGEGQGASRGSGPTSGDSDQIGPLS